MCLFRMKMPLLSQVASIDRTPIISTYIGQTRIIPIPNCRFSWGSFCLASLIAPYSISNLRVSITIYIHAFVYLPTYSLLLITTLFLLLLGYSTPQARLHGTRHSCPPSYPCLRERGRNNFFFFFRSQAHIVCRFAPPSIIHPSTHSHTLCSSP